MRQVAMQAAAHAGERAAGAHGGDEVSEQAIGLFDNFAAGGFEMRFPVSRVIVLIGVKITVGVGFVDLAALADGAVGAFSRIAEYHLRAISLEDALALDGSVGGQAQPDAIAARGADHGIGNAGVAACGIQNGVLGTEAAGALAIEDHVEAGTVLYRSAGIEVFRLGVDGDAGHLAADLFQAQQWRVANGGQQVLSLGPDGIGDECGSHSLYRF